MEGGFSPFPCARSVPPRTATSLWRRPLRAGIALAGAVECRAQEGFGGVCISLIRMPAPLR
jgi:hypothetical protein